MRSKYEDLKSALKGAGFIVDRDDAGARLTHIADEYFGSTNIFSRNDNSRWELTELVAAIDAQTEKTDIQKYFLLLLGCQKVCTKLSQDFHRHAGMSITGFEEHGVLKNLKTILNYPTDSQRMLDQQSRADEEAVVKQDDILFAQLYLMGKEAFGIDFVKPILDKIVNPGEENYSTKDGCDAILELAYSNFIHARNEQDRQALLDIIIAHRRKCCDPIYLSSERDTEVGFLLGTLGVRKSSLPVDQVIWYQAHAAIESDNTDHADYLSSLSALSKNSTSLHFSQSMRDALNGIIIHSNKLYQDSSVSNANKRQCAELSNLVATFSGTVAEIKDAENARKFNIPGTAHDPKDIHALKGTLDGQVQAITQKIQEFSKDAKKSPRWGRIIGLTLLTLGLGLIGIIPAINRGDAFFTREHPIATQARQLITEGHSAIEDTRVQLTQKSALAMGPVPTLEF